ncbi:MAG TPA: ribosomal protein S18-alanine N-acetyltransferase [Dehalococcoidales bacterium]|nr:ribosomal protein S18-alanine N-acetyltransferase [Dehalococcoidales bacterium]
MTYSIRPLEKEDLEQVNEIDREAFPTQWPPPNYKQELQNKIAHYIVATDDSRAVDPEVAGQSFMQRLMPWLKPAAPEEKPRLYIAGFAGIWMLVDEAHITNIAVRKEYRGKGIGGLLLIATFDLAAELSASFLTLEVRASNEVAQKLYERYGFTKAGLRRAYYLDNREDAIIMSTAAISSAEVQERMSALRESLKIKLTANS